MKCEECGIRDGVIRYRVRNMTFFLCVDCASVYVERLRKNIAALNKQIREIRKTIPEAWIEFMREKQTT